MAEQMISESSQHNVKKVFWRIRDLEYSTGLSHRTIMRLRASGRLPQPDAVFGTALAWRPATIENWAMAGGLNSVRGAR
jgi:predicted DNA-binding transcriptional regulator AlpA